MRFVSNIVSSQKNEFSLLAFIETLCAIGVSVAIGIYASSFFHFYITTLVAPLLLLRTRLSEVYGVSWFAKFFGWFTATPLWYFLNDWRNPETTRSRLTGILPGFMCPIAGFSIAIFVNSFTSVFIIPVSLCIRAGATYYCALKAPLPTIKSIPKNWERAVLATDSFTPPELLPTIRKYQDLDFFYFPNGIKLVNNSIRFQDLSLPNKIAAYCVTLPVFTIPLVPIMLFRWSLKSTAYFYYPFVWIANAKQIESKPAWLKKLVRSKLAKREQALSWGIVIGSLTVAFDPDSIAPEYISSSIEYFSNLAIGRYLVPNPQFDPWHYTALTAAGSSILMKYYGDLLLIEYEETKGIGPWQIYAIQSLHVTRLICAFFTILLGITIIIFHESSNFHER